ncbi:FliA/WhiG family RNA polymerase sigma factor [Bacillus tuaregi]|uniref:FliA/WhiG family RNA polymerase sigma factor n=1 Tax=Bacillus tuaregi TaxID=1816695 RepID=UPI0008F89ECB|nr:FliA/WhiG family RNA polymerase sigma factor [Bacillus tuaregi]
MVHAATLDEQLYWDKWVTCRDKDAANILMKRYLSLVSYHVQRISVSLPKTVSRDDLTSLGMIGLYDALEKFDPNRDLKFETYASFRVRGAILDGLRKEDWLSRSSREKAKKIDAVIESLEQKYLRHVTEEEIADELNITVAEVYAIMNEQFFANMLSIDEQPEDPEDKSKQSFIIKDERGESPEQTLLKNEAIEEMTGIISTLNENEQLVISLFYQEELTLTEIGQIMGLSTSRISQIHTKCIYKLRQALRK